MKSTVSFFLLFLIPSITFGQVASNTLDPFLVSESAAASSWRADSLISIGMDNFEGEDRQDNVVMDDLKTTTFSVLGVYKTTGFGLEAGMIDRETKVEGVTGFNNVLNKAKNVPLLLHLMFSENLSFGIESIKAENTNESKYSDSTGDTFQYNETNISKTGITLGLRMAESFYFSAGLRNVHSSGKVEKTSTWDPSSDVKTDLQDLYWQEQLYAIAYRTANNSSTKFHLEMWNIISGEAKKDAGPTDPPEATNMHPKTEEQGFSIEAQFSEYYFGYHNMDIRESKLSFDALSSEKNTSRTLYGIGWFSRDCLSISLYRFHELQENQNWDQGIMAYRKHEVEDQGLKMQLGLIF